MAKSVWVRLPDSRVLRSRALSASFISTNSSSTDERPRTRRKTLAAKLLLSFGVRDRIVCRVLGLPLSRVWMFRQAPATLNVMSGPSLAELQLVRLNDSEHSAPLLREATHRAL